jgi:hypothetical protein
VSWQLDGGALTDTNPLEFAMNADHSATAVCVPLFELEVVSNGCCDITVEYDGMSDIVGPMSTQVFNLMEGTDVSLTVGTSATCEFIDWQVDGNAPVTTPQIMVDMNSDHTAVATCESTSIFIHLDEGWNTFSIPIALDPAMDTWGEFVTSNGLSVDAVLYYDSVGHLWVGVQEDDMVELLQGYYILMADAGTAEIIPNPNQTPPPTRMLVQGLNCIGIAALHNPDVAEYLSTIYISNDGIGYTLVLNPAINPNAGWTNGVYIRDALNSPEFMVGKAYWVHMMNPIELVGWTQTPLN